MEYVTYKMWCLSPLKAIIFGFIDGRRITCFIFWFPENLQWAFLSLGEQQTYRLSSGVFSIPPHSVCQQRISLLPEFITTQIMLIWHGWNYTGYLSSSTAWLCFYLYKFLMQLCFKTVLKLCNVDQCSDVWMQLSP